MIARQDQLSADTLRSVIDDVFASSEFAWNQRFDFWQWLGERFNDLTRWLAALHEAHPVAYYVFLGANLLILGGIVAHVAILILRAMRYRESSEAADRPLPSRPRDADWYLQEARDLGRRGEYVRALEHRFTALVLELDRQRVVHFHPAKTPAEYLREARVTADGHVLLTDVVRNLYAHVFGGVPCHAEGWDAFDRAAGAVRAHAAAN